MDTNFGAAARAGIERFGILAKPSFLEHATTLTTKVERCAAGRVDGRGFSTLG